MSDESQPTSPTEPTPSDQTKTPPAKPKNMFERHPWLTNIFIIGFMTIFMDVMMAQFVKFMPKPPAPDETAYRTKHKLYHHDLKPDMTYDRAQWGKNIYEVTTNSLGFKDHIQREVAMKPDRHRILFVGDSFTEGVGYTYNETFVGLVAKELEAKNIEVLNAGVQSYCPMIHLFKIRYWMEQGLEFDELVCFIDISDIYDETKSYEVRDGAVMDSKSGLKERRANQEKIAGKKFSVKDLIKTNTILISFLLRKARDLTVGNYYLNNRRSLWTFKDRGEYEAFGKKGLASCQQNMDQLLALLRERGVKLTVAVYPWPDQIHRHDRDSIQVKTWQAWVDRHNESKGENDPEIRFLDYFPDFIPEKPWSSDSDWQNVLDTYFIPGDVHWNDKGMKLIADRFLTFYNAKD